MALSPSWDLAESTQGLDAAIARNPLPRAQIIPLPVFPSATSEPRRSKADCKELRAAEGETAAREQPPDCGRDLNRASVCLFFMRAAGTSRG